LTNYADADEGSMGYSVAFNGIAYMAKEEFRVPQAVPVWRFRGDDVREPFIRRTARR